MERADLAVMVGALTRRVRFPGRFALLHGLFPPESFRRGEASDRWYHSYDGNLEILCSLGSFIEWNILLTGYYHPDLSRAIKALVHPGITAIDVGANIGAYTLLMAKVIGPTGKTIAFEPNPEVHKRLLLNIAANRFAARVDVESLALSASRSRGTLFRPRGDYHHRGIASLHKYSADLTEQIPVVVSTIDDEIDRRGLRRVDLIKVDTEGNDAEVLAGGKETISRHVPVIVFEANRRAHQVAGIDLEDTRLWLGRLGYRFWTVGLFGRLRSLPPLVRFPDTNIVCLPAAQ